MTTSGEQPNPTLIRLGDTDRTIPNPDEDVRGRKVTDADGESLGKVADLLVDDTASHARFLVVEHGGVLGIGATESFLPIDAITDIADDEVFVDTDMRTVAGAPEYDPEIALESNYFLDVYDYYGYTPFWASGAVAPGFPYFGHRGR